MPQDPAGDSNPFEDPEMGEAPSEATSAEVTTLSVGRNALLKLGKDSLVVQDEGLVDKEGFNCFGLLPSRQKATRTIPFYNVVWAELSEFEITVHYVRTVSKSVVRPAFINYPIDKTDRRGAEAWVSRLLDRAYGASQRCKRIKILINPFGGKGKAQKYFTRDIEPIFAAARCQIDVENTQYSGHAIELVADKVRIDDWDVIACCSGDGVVYEVFNGLAKKSDAARALAQIAVVQLPCGSGNAMSLNMNGTDSPSLAALAVVKGLRTPLDLASVTQGETRTLSFLSQALGIVAETDLATEHLRFLGSARFTYGFLVRLFRKTIYPIDVSLCIEADSKAEVREIYAREAARTPHYNANKQIEERPLPEPGAPLPPLRYGTVNDPLPEGWTAMAPYDNMGSFYAGGLAFMAPDAPFFPAALPNDGCYDLLTINGDIPRLKSIQTLLAIPEYKMFDLPHVRYRKVRGLRVIPRQKVAPENGYISIDGERVPFEPFQVEVHSGLGTTLSRSGHLFESKGP